MTEASVSFEDQMELDKLEEIIDKYTCKVEQINNLLQELEEENQSDSVSQQIAVYQSAFESHPDTIPAEDAFEVITRLQNTLKIVQRRNHLLEKEAATQARLLEERSNILLNVTKEYDHIVDVTGWHENFVFDAEELHSKMEDIKEMADLELTVQRELRAAQGIIKKKETALRQLEELLEQGKEQDIMLNDVYNDIRVKERDCSEVEMQLVRLRKSVAKTDKALALFDVQSPNASLKYMEGDRDYLRDNVAEMKVVTRRQDSVIKAQLTRQQQLQTRLDIIMRSLREMKLDKKYERNILKEALVPSVSREEPEDVSKILPEVESIPIPTYRLLHKNNEMLHDAVMRKNMLVLEKNSVIEALEAGLAKYGVALVTTYKEQQDLRQNKDMEMVELMDDLQQQHSNYLEKLEELRLQNANLKKRMYRATRQRGAAKGSRSVR